MSINYMNKQFHRVRVTTPTAADIEFELWSKSYQWRIIGFDAKILTAPATGATLKLSNTTTSKDLVTQDLGTDAADTTYEVRVPVGGSTLGDGLDSLVEPGEIVELISTETDAAVVVDVTVIATDTSA